jgi:hypothetical protein
MKSLFVLLKLLHERFPCAGLARHNITLQDDTLRLYIFANDVWQSVNLEEIDYDRDPVELFGEIVSLVEVELAK